MRAGRLEARGIALRKAAAACAAAGALAALAWIAVREDSILPASAAAPRAESPTEGRGSPALQGVRPVASASVTPSSVVAPSPPDAALERQAVPAGSSERCRLRGRFVDARTGQGLPQVEVKMRSGDQVTRDLVQTTSEGRFTSLQEFASGSVWLWGSDSLAGRSFGRKEHGHAAPHSEGIGELEWRVSVGPTLIARLFNAPEDCVWRLRLVEDLGQREQQEWTWLYAKELASDGALGVRYSHYEHEPALFREVRIQVASSDDVWRGEARIEGTPGVHEVEVRVEAVGTTLEGVVLDEGRNPVAATLVAMKSEPVLTSRLHWPETTTDEAGWFRLSTLDPGSVHLLVSSDHRAVERVDVELSPGERKSVEIVLPRVALAGDVRGVLAGPMEGEEPIGIVRLVSADGGRTDLVRMCVAMSFAANPPGDGLTPFAFEDLPQGRYRVSVLSLDGRTLAPESILVEAPGQVEFRTDQVAAPVDSSRYSLTVSDARTGERLKDVRAVFHLPPFWSTNFSLGDPIRALAFLGETAPLTLVVACEGYVPAALFLPEAYRTARRDGGRVEVQLDLEPGHGLALVVLDAGQTLGGRGARSSQLSAMPALAGARVLARGRVLGTSDARGLALCRSSDPIDDFEVELPGWTALSTQGFDEGTVHRARLVRGKLHSVRFVFMVRP